MMRSKSADTIRAQVNVYHLTRSRIHDCISSFAKKLKYLLKLWQGPYMRLLNCEIITISAFNGLAIATDITRPWKADLEMISAFSVAFHLLLIGIITHFELGEVSLACFLRPNHSRSYGEFVKGKSGELIDAQKSHFEGSRVYNN